MKAFVIAMLAMGTALLLAALFWPDRPPVRASEIGRGDVLSGASQ